ncbi:hypothetical protein BJX99DRAFT_217844 [Aspergillus californicus]
MFSACFMLSSMFSAFMNHDSSADSVLGHVGRRQLPTHLKKMWPANHGRNLSKTNISKTNTSKTNINIDMV